jgi:hypothetical protein
MPETEHPDHARIKRYRAKALEAAQCAAQCRDNSMLDGWRALVTAYTSMADALELQMSARRHI